MALEEISFYNTNGEEISVSNIVNQMINYFNLKLEVGETRLTDFNEGSEIRNILEAFAIGIYALLDEQHEATQIAFISTSYGTWLDRIGELPFINLPRVQSEYAQGEVTFTLGTAQVSDFVIPSDTILLCSDTGLDFITVDDCIINSGELTGDVAVECLSPGVDGNVQALSIDTIVSEGVDTELVSVSNQAGLDGGSDEELDEDYRQRLLDNVRADGFGTLGYYINLCEDVDGVHDVLLVSDASFTRKVIVNGSVKPTSDLVLLDVLSKLTDTGNIVLGHSFTVDSPAYECGHSLEITLDVATELPVDDLETVVRKVFDGGAFYEMAFDGLSIGESLSREMIVDALGLFGDVIGVSSITEDDVEVSVLTPDSGDVLTLDDVTFVQNEV